MKVGENMKVYIDHDFKCYTEQNINNDLIETQMDTFADKSDKYIEGLRFVPEGQTWVRADGKVFEGEMVAPWRDSDVLEEFDVIVKELEQKHEEEIEPMITQIKSALDLVPDILKEPVQAVLTMLPKAGEEWSSEKNYIQGDTVVYENTNYTAQKYSKNKQPNLFVEHWGITAQTPDYPEWDSVTDGTLITVSEKVLHNAMVWNCTKQHIKSVLYEPKDGSKQWEIYTGEGV